MFLLQSDSMPGEEKILLSAVAQVVISSEFGTLEQQLGRPEVEPPLPLQSAPVDEAADDTKPDDQLQPSLLLGNGTGGFTREGREYVVVLEGERETPLPRVNVLANPRFGSIVTTSGHPPGPANQGPGGAVGGS